jgi:hypothetical protein
MASLIRTITPTPTQQEHQEEDEEEEETEICSICLETLPRWAHKFMRLPYEYRPERDILL